jgi:hypothetical protein
VIRVLRAAQRFRSSGPGIQSWHCLSAGAHYDPANVVFGPIIGVDEHVLAPGAGFGRHAHAGVDIVSWVLAGTLRHENSTGRIELLGPGKALWQHAASRIEHAETNPSVDEPLRFVQTTLLGAGADEPSCAIMSTPLLVGTARFEVITGAAQIAAQAAHLYVTAGRFTVEATGEEVTAGDSVRCDGPVRVDGAGELLVWHWPR